MSDDTTTKDWDDWFADPPEPDPDTERFKWGWNEADGEAVWEVAGPGDGWPAHADELEAAWGRAELNAGDVIGAAEHVPARGSDPAAVVIRAYFGAPVPDAVITWFRGAFPDAQVRQVGPE